MAKNTQPYGGEPYDFQDNEEKRDWIYLIKPNGFTPDVVYKIFQKGNDFYFCRVGGQFYDIRETMPLNAQTPEELLLKSKRNFKISKYDIASVVIDANKSMWTGNLQNNGKLRFDMGGKKQKYIIHAVESPIRVADFFQAACTCSVQRLHMKKYETARQALKKEEIQLNTSDDYKTALKSSRIVNILAIICALWFLLYPQPYLAAAFADLATIVAGLLFLIKYREYVRFDNASFYKKPDFSLAVFMPSMALALRSMNDYNVFYNLTFWICVAMLSIFCTFFLALPAGLYQKSKSTAILMIVPLFALFYGSSVMINCRLDFSTPSNYVTRVETMETDSGSYYLTVAPWGTETKPVDVQVRQSIYDRIHTGENVIIAQRRGLFEVSWYRVSSN